MKIICLKGFVSFEFGMKVLRQEAVRLTGVIAVENAFCFQKTQILVYRGPLTMNNERKNARQRKLFRFGGNSGF